MSRSGAAAVTRTPRERAAPAPRARTRSANADADELSSLLDKGLKVSTRAGNDSVTTRPAPDLGRKAKDKVAAMKTLTVRKAASSASLTSVAPNQPERGARATSKTEVRAGSSAAVGDIPAAKKAAVRTASSSGKTAAPPRSPSGQTAPRHARTLSTAQRSASTVSRTASGAQTSQCATSSVPSDAVRAKTAMDQANKALRELSSAVMGGYKYGREQQQQSRSGSASTPRAAASSSKAAAPANTSTWTDARLDEIVDEGTRGITVLRCLSREGVLKNKQIEIETSALMMLGRMTGLEMFKAGAEGLTTSRKAILGLYPHADSAAVIESAHLLESTASRLTRTPISQSSSRAASAPSPRASGTVDPLQLLSFPPAATTSSSNSAPQNQGLNDAIESLLFKHLTLSWATALRLATGREEASSTLLEMERIAGTTGSQVLHPFAPELANTAQRSRPHMKLVYEAAVAAISAASEQDLKVRIAAFKLEVRLLVAMQGSELQAADIWKRLEKRLNALVASGEDLGGVVTFGLWAIDYIQLAKVLRDDEGGRTALARVAELLRWAGRKTSDLAVAYRLGQLVKAALPISNIDDLTQDVQRLQIQSDDADVQLQALNIDLARAVSILETPTTEAVQAGQITEALRAIRFEAATSAVSSSSVKPSMGQLRSLARYAEKLRRALDRAKQTALDPGKGTLACLEGILGLLETCLASCSIDNETKDRLEATAVASAIDATNIAFQRGDQTTYRTTTELIQRGISIAQRVTADNNRAEYLRCMSCNAYNCGGRLWRDKDYASAIPFLEIAAAIGDEALALCRKASQGAPLSKAWSQLDAQMRARWEALAVAHQKTHQKAQATQAFARSFAVLTPPTQDNLARLAATQPLDAVSSSHADLDAAISRYAGFLAAESLFVQSEALQVLPPLESPVAALLVERLVKHLERLEHRADIASLLRGILLSLLSFYEPSRYPVRRQRVLSKLTQLSCLYSAGEHDLARVESSSPADSHHFDAGLSPLLQQYDISYKAWSAVRTHHSTAGIQREALLNVAADLERALLALVDAFGDSTPEETVPVQARMSAERNSKRGTRSPHAPRTAVPVTPPAGHPPPASKRLQESRLLDDGDRFMWTIEAFLAVLDSHGLGNRKLCLLRCMQSLGALQDVATGLTWSSKIASEYARIGLHSKAAIIFSQASHTLENSIAKPDPGVSVELYVRFALCQATVGIKDHSLRLLEQAAAVATQSGDSAGCFSADKMRRQGQIRQWIASAHVVLSIIARNGDDAVTEIIHLTAALQVQTAALRRFFHLAVELPQAQAMEDVTAGDVFGLDSSDSRLGSPDAPSRPTFVSDRRLGAEQLGALLSYVQISSELASALLRFGSSKKAATVLQQAHLLASSSTSPVLAAKLACGLAEVALSVGDEVGVSERLSEATQSWDWLDEMEQAKLHMTRAKLLIREGKREEAAALLQAAVVAIHSHEAQIDGTQQIVLSSGQNVEVPSLRATPSPRERQCRPFGIALGPILRQLSFLLRGLNDVPRSNDLYAQAQSLIYTATDDADLNFLAGQLKVADTFGAFQSNVFTSSLVESNLTLPVGCLNKPATQLKETRSAVVLNLQQGMRHFASHLALVQNGGAVPTTRQAALRAAVLRIYQEALLPHQSQDTDAAATVKALDFAAALTMTRDMQYAVAQRCITQTSSEVEWPSLAGNASKASQTESTSTSSASRYWQIAGKRYTADCRSAADENKADRLPSPWPVIHINLAEDGDFLILSRSQAGRPATVFTLPLDRQGKREDEGDEEMFGFSAAIGELRDIIAASDLTSREAKTVSSQQGRADWWQKRKALDKRLEELLNDIESNWLGAFKTIFMTPNEAATDELAKLKTTLEDIFRQALLYNHDRAKPPRIKLDEHVIGCFSSLGSTARPQEYEDLVYYILDLHHCYGVNVVPAELDIDQICIDVQAAFQTYEIATRRAATTDPNEHVFLVLDHRVQEIPWESLPVLRGRSVARVPAVSFLLDRLELTAARNDGTGSGQDKFIVNASKTHYILNPSTDLVRTQAHFEGWMTGMHAHGWSGRVARPVLELDFQNALEESDLLLYFGHGGGEQYITSNKIRNLENCAVAMLWGCSSGALKDNGDLDCTGTANNYMIGGCPSLIANLWDVTDKDIDKLSSAVMRDLNLDPTHANDATQLSMSNVQALNRNRDECKLKYLTGAAPVVYGIPVYFAYGGVEQ